MNQLCDSSKFDSSKQERPWIVEYDTAIQMGKSIDDLINILDEQLQLEECRFLCANETLDNFTTLEQCAKKAIDYDDRMNYLISKKKSKVLK